MACGSKRKRIKAVICKTFSRRNGKAEPSDIQRDKTSNPLNEQVICSDVSVYESSPNASLPISESLHQAPGVSAMPSGGFFPNANHFSVNNCVMVDKSTVHIHGESNARTQAIKLLFKHIIPGATHNSSARDPPPKCHPGTRVEINNTIVTWFYDEEKGKLLIWIYGPAGVGKSAIMQTLAEKLAESKHLGASAFVSRPNGRNASRQLFLTIAYQLAVHIEDYCTFITEKLGQDPELVNRGMKDQFNTFIVEPFVEKKIGVGSGPWGILLDGLDELDEHRSQREVIRLIANFVLDHPNIPLLWIIASRPEPHIYDTFHNKQIVPAYLSKAVPANSQASCRDVERFLRDSLERIKEDFPRTVPKKWPSEEQFSHLAAAASGLFAFADTAIRFIEDPRYANPTMRLGQVLSSLNGVTVTSHDRPFASLDALYTSILSSIPSDVWPTTKRVLGALLYAQRDRHRQAMRKLVPMSIILRLDLNTVYASVQSCYSLLIISDPEHADLKPVNLYHASFSDYLLDSTRSGNFFISMVDVEDDMLQLSLDVWEEFMTSYPPVPDSTYESRWSKYLETMNSFHSQKELKQYIHDVLFTFMVEKHDPKTENPFSSQEDQDQCFKLLSQLEDETIYSGFLAVGKLKEFLPWLFDMWEIYQEKLVSRKAIQDVGLQQAQLSQFGPCAARVQVIQDNSIVDEQLYQLTFDRLHSELLYLQQRYPQLPVLSCGLQERGCLFLKHQADELDLEIHDLYSMSPDKGPVWRYFAIPYSQSYFNHDAEHMLRINFEVMQTKYPQLISESWPSQEQLLKLAGAASHQPVFANIAIQFIEDPHFGDPVLRLNQVLALIDEVDLSNDHPFIYVDALYTHILSSIPSNMWPITQQVLGALYQGLLDPYSPMAISTLFGIKLSAVYTALSACYPMVQTSSRKMLGLESVFSYHPSFCEYLRDPTRSQIFYISMEDIQIYMLKLLMNIWQDFKNQFHRASDQDYFSVWTKYWSQYYPTAGSLLANNLHVKFFHDVHLAPLFVIGMHNTAEPRSEQCMDQMLDMLSNLDFTTIHFGLKWQLWKEIVLTLFDVWFTRHEKFAPDKLANRGLVHYMDLQDLQFDHLTYSYSYFHVLSSGTHFRGMGELMEATMLTSSEEFEEYILGLKRFQQHQPKTEVLIGGRPGKRFAVFEYEYMEDDLGEKLHYPQNWTLYPEDVGYYIIPYPDS